MELQSCGSSKFGAPVKIVYTDIDSMDKITIPSVLDTLPIGMLFRNQKSLIKRLHTRSSSFSSDQCFNIIP